MKIAMDFVDKAGGVLQMDVSYSINVPQKPLKINIQSSDNMSFTYKELAYLNKMIVIALMSGKIEFDEISESVHKKVANEILKRNTEVLKARDAMEKTG